jgi:hypothetical protein
MTGTRVASASATGNPWVWALARIGFHAYIVFSMATVVGGFLTAPIVSYLFFGTWRFWRYLDLSWKLYVHGLHMAWRVLTDEQTAFMFDVPLLSPPHSKPDPALAQLNPRWEHGTSCGTCTRCCGTVVRCPILDARTGLCRGYESFFWRFFNCGRFPSAQREIAYYGCPKWEIKPGAEPIPWPGQDPVPAVRRMAQLD